MAETFYFNGEVYDDENNNNDETTVSMEVLDLPVHDEDDYEKSDILNDMLKRALPPEKRELPPQLSTPSSSLVFWH